MNFIKINNTETKIMQAIFDSKRSNEMSFFIENNFKVKQTDKNIDILFSNKESINEFELTKIASKLASSLKEDLTIDLDSFCTDKINLNKVAYIMATNFSVFTKKMVCLKSKPNKEIKIFYLSKNIDKVNQEYLNIVVKSINDARFIQEMPPNLMTADKFCQQTIKNAENVKNLKITILDKKEIVKRNMGLLLGVNQGSINEPRVAILEYQGNNSSKEKTAFIGKGITFDSGGYNIKIGANMRGMKFDLSGAAVVANTLIAIAKLNLNKNVVGICSLAENMVSGEGIKSDDVLTSMSKNTVEIVNTDAEGRLVLGDAVTLAVKEYKPTEIFTIATLTGAIGISLGDYFTGVFSKEDELYNKFFKSSLQSMEPMWRMPLIDEHKKSLLNSRIADILHLPEGGQGRMGSSSTAAAFMWLFAENIPFLHCDIAYTSHKGLDEATGCVLKTFVKYCE